MKKYSLVGCLISFIIIVYSPLFAEEIIETELITTVNHSLSSDPQPGVDFHVIKVCKDYEMFEDCKECTYEANLDGSLNIPTYNKCVFRVEQETSYEIGNNQSYKFYFQLKAASNTGAESEWTEPKIVSIVKTHNNNSKYSYAYLFVQYDHE